MNFYPFLHLSGTFICLFMIVYALKNDYKSILNRSFVLVAGCFAVWSFATAFIHNNTISREIALFYDDLGSLGWCSFPSAFLWFAVVFAGKNKLIKNKLFKLGIIFISLFFFFLQWGRFGVINDMIKREYGWYAVYNKNIFVYFYYIYYISFTLIGAYFVRDKGRQSRRKIAKHASGLIFWAAIIALIVGTITDILIPTFFTNIEFPDVADTGSVFWIAAMLYATLKYKLFSMSPAKAADNILTVMNDSLVLVDEKGSIFKINKSAAKLLEYNETEVLGQPVNHLFKDKAISESVLKGNISSQEIAIKTKTNKSIPVILSSSLLFDEYKNMDGAVCILKDITDIKQSEQEKDNLQAQLFQSEKMSAVGQLAGGIAHEINNPLTGVLSSVQLINLMAKTKQDCNVEDFRELLDAIEISGLRCKKITEAFLNFARTSGRYFQPVYINELIEKSISLVKCEINISNLRIKTDFEADSPVISGDPQLLQQAIFDIIDNAKWAVTKKTGKEFGEIAIKTELKTDSIYIYISDNGVGISQENKPKLFQPFFTTKPEGEGTGLGLSIIKKIIDIHKGIIEVESELGKGTTFKIILPIGFDVK